MKGTGRLEHSRLRVLHSAHTCVTQLKLPPWGNHWSSPPRRITLGMRLICCVGKRAKLQFAVCFSWVFIGAARSRAPMGTYELGQVSSAIHYWCVSNLLCLVRTMVVAARCGFPQGLARPALWFDCPHCYVQPMCGPWDGKWSLSGYKSLAPFGAMHLAARHGATVMGTSVLVEACMGIVHAYGA